MLQNLKTKENKNRQRSCLEVHTQNVSAHNYNRYMWKMTENKQVNVSVFSFLLFLFPLLLGGWWGFLWGGGEGGGLWLLTG